MFETPFVEHRMCAWRPTRAMESQSCAAGLGVPRQVPRKRGVMRGPPLRAFGNQARWYTPRLTIGLPMAEATAPVRLRFGVFEVDLRAGELRKHGVRLRLQEQPFQLLAMLLERPGETVTREELRNRLWTAETFVDFDHGVNKAINRIREALGDSATSPRFVETVARRGYRFIADVTVVDETPPVRPAVKAGRRWYPLVTAGIALAVVSIVVAVW